MTLPLLQPGDTIGVMAPSSYVEREDIEKSKAAVEQRGFTVFIHPQTYTQHHQSAGTPVEKLDALHALYADPGIQAIWLAGGGNRSLMLLDHLDTTLIRKNPKPLIGMSDNTTLLNAVLARAQAPAWYAQVFKALHRFEDTDLTFDVLTGQKKEMLFADAQIIQSGSARGKLVGGCLSLFHYLAGTSDCADLEGAVLFLEDYGDHLSRFDRMFLQLKRLGVFKKISALVLGEFLDLQDGKRPFGFSLEEIISESVGERDIPVIINAPFGHEKKLFPLPLGASAFVDTSRKTLTLEQF